MSQPLVSIIVTSYCQESRAYLDQCIKSIANLSYPNIETIIVGRRDYNMPEYANARTIAPDEGSFWNGHGINYGVEHSSGEYLLIVNDDCVLTRDSVAPLVNALKHPEIGQVMPASNDQQFRYYIPYLMHHFEYMERSGQADKLGDALCHGPQGLMFADTLCLYAHMLRRETWDRVGGMDDNSGLIDIDYSLRMRQAGLMNAIELSSIIWHWGGRSVTHTLDTPKRLKQRDQFKAKWGWVP